MQKIFSYLMIGSLLMLVGCTSEVAKLPHMDPNMRIAQDRAVLVVKVGNFDYLDITKVDSADPKSRSVKYRILKPSKMFLDTYAKQIYDIEAGTYYISFVAIDSANGTYYSEAPGLDTHGSIAYGAFNIKPGEVLYLGDFDCRWQSSNKIKKLSLINNMTEVKRDLESAGHSELAAKVVMAKFYARGTNINNIQQQQD